MHDMFFHTFAKQVVDGNKIDSVENKAEFEKTAAKLNQRLYDHITAKARLREVWCEVDFKRSTSREIRFKLECLRMDGHVRLSPVTITADLVHGFTVHVGVPGDDVSRRNIGAEIASAFRMVEVNCGCVIDATLSNIEEEVSRARRHYINLAVDIGVVN